MTPSNEDMRRLKVLKKINNARKKLKNILSKNSFATLKMYHGLYNSSSATNSRIKSGHAGYRSYMRITKQMKELDAELKRIENRSEIDPEEFIDRPPLHEITLDSNSDENMMDTNINNFNESHVSNSTNSNVTCNFASMNTIENLNVMSHVNGNVEDNSHEMDYDYDISRSEDSNNDNEMENSNVINNDVEMNESDEHTYSHCDNCKRHQSTYLVESFSQDSPYFLSLSPVNICEIRRKKFKHSDLNANNSNTFILCQTIIPQR